MTANEAPFSALRVWLFGLFAACVLCVQYPLMYAARNSWASNFPKEQAQWQHNGRFAVLAYYGAEVGDELFYAPKVKEAALRLKPRDPHVLKEQTASNTMMDYLTYLPMGLAFRATGDIQWAWILTRFLAAILWFVLLYSAMLRLGAAPSFAAACAVFLCGYSYLLTMQFTAALHWSGGLLKTLARSAYVMASYGRTEGLWRAPRPAVTYLFLFAATLLWARACAQRTPRSLVAAGVFCGLLAYARMDIWSAVFGACCGFPVLVALVERRLDWRLFLPAALDAVVSLPMTLATFPMSQDVLLRAGAVWGRHFDPVAVVYGAAIAAALWRATREKAAGKSPALLPLWIASLLAAVAAVCNASLITGYSFHPAVWKFFANIMLFLLAASFVPKAWQQRTLVWQGAAALLLAGAGLQNAVYAAIHYPHQAIPRAYEEAFDWLQANAPRDSVVLALNPEINLLLPVYSDAKAAIALSAVHLSGVTAMENASRLRFALRSFDVDRERFWKNAVAVDTGVDTRRVFDRALLDPALIRPTYFGAYPLPKARELYDVAPDEAYPLDYVWVGYMEKGYAGKGFPDKTGLKLEPAFSNGAVALYKVVR